MLHLLLPVQNHVLLSVFTKAVETFSNSDFKPLVERKACKSFVHHSETLRLFCLVLNQFRKPHHWLN